MRSEEVPWCEAAGLRHRGGSWGAAVMAVGLERLWVRLLSELCEAVETPGNSEPPHTPPAPSAAPRVVPVQAQTQAPGWTTGLY